MRFFIFVVATMLLIACSEKKAPAPGAVAGAVQVDVVVVSSSPYQRNIETSGTMMASEFVELKTEVGGRVTQLNIKEGQYVEAGTLLLKLHDEDLQAQRSKYVSQLAIAQKTLDRLNKLLEAGGANQQEIDQVRSQTEGLKADIDFTDAQIRKTELRAPFSGTLGLRLVSPGAMLSPQDIVGTLIQLNPMKVDFVLPEEQSGLVRNGALVKVVTSAFDTLSAAVIASAVRADAGTRNIVYRSQLQEAVNNIQPGAFVKVLIATDNSKEVMMIPTNCVIPDSRSKKVVLIRQGKAQFQTIETGFRTENSVQVVSGIASGDTVATTGLLFLKPDARVSIRSIQ